MSLKEWQKKVDTWIKQYGVRYFDPMTNMLLLVEEVGELARLIARMNGEQSFKEPVDKEKGKAMIADEMADILFVLTCLANQSGVDLQDAASNNLQKKTTRDSGRHRLNPKLKN